MHPDTRQRIVDTFSVYYLRSAILGCCSSLHQVPRDISAKKITYGPENAEVQCMPIIIPFWYQLTQTGSDGHRGVYPFDFLVAHQNTPNQKLRKYNDEIEFRYVAVSLTNLFVANGQGLQIPRSGEYGLSNRSF